MVHAAKIVSFIHKTIGGDLWSHDRHLRRDFMDWLVSDGQRLLGTGRTTDQISSSRQDPPGYISYFH